jgi:hypothetical protein
MASRNMRPTGKPAGLSPADLQRHAEPVAYLTSAPIADVPYDRYPTPLVAKDDAPCGVLAQTALYALITSPTEMRFDRLGELATGAHEGS